MSETTGALAAALAKVQAELPTLERDRTVTVQQKSGGTYSYSYVTLATLTDAVLPLLAKNGLAFTAFPALAADGKMSLRYHLLHSSGEKLTGEFPISGEGGIQMIGGRITYSRRYCLAAVVGIAADEDDETHLANEGAPRTAQRNTRPRQNQDAPQTAGTRKRAAAPPPLPSDKPDGGMSPDQRSKLMAMFGELGITDRAERLKVTSQIVGRELSSANDLTGAETSRVIDELAARLEQAFERRDEEPPPEDDQPTLGAP